MKGYVDKCFLKLPNCKKLFSKIWFYSINVFTIKIHCNKLNFTKVPLIHKHAITVKQQSLDNNFPFQVYDIATGALAYLI